MVGLVERRRHRVVQATVLQLRLRAMLKAYYPVVLELFEDHLGIALACHFLQKWPDQPSLQKARPTTLRQFFGSTSMRPSARPSFKWIRIVWRLWTNRQRYQEDIYLESSRRKNHAVSQPPSHVNIFLPNA